jgi:hypothetical protein
MGRWAFDNAISEKAAQIKGIRSPVSGDVDILVVPGWKRATCCSNNCNISRTLKPPEWWWGKRAGRAHQSRRQCADPHGVYGGGLSSSPPRIGASPVKDAVFAVTR